MSSLLTGPEGRKPNETLPLKHKSVVTCSLTQTHTDREQQRGETDRRVKMDKFQVNSPSFLLNTLLLQVHHLFVVPVIKLRTRRDRDFLSVAVFYFIMIITICSYFNCIVLCDSMSL